MSDLRKQLRIEQTISQVERLENEFLEWRQRRNQADSKRQYQTQLQALHGVVCKALADIKEDTRQLSPAETEIGQLYSQCRLHEKRALWVRRVLWGYFRPKFDQRDQSDLRQLLETADDVVWSCYKEAFQNAAKYDSAFKALKPIPLAYIEPLYAPQALPRDEPPGILKEQRLGARFLADYISQLPIPVVSFPPLCVAAPWWLVFLAHEVGHHVQHDLNLVLPFGERLRATVTAPPAPVESHTQAERWYKWGQEIFADAFSVYMLGLSAVWAMIELVTAPDADMLLREDRYPSPLVRLTLLARLAKNLGLDGDAALAEINPDRLVSLPLAQDYEQEWQQESAADLALLPKIIDTVTGQKVGELVTLRQLTGWNNVDYVKFGASSQWQAALEKGQPRKAQRTLRSARVILAAGFAAWRKLSVSTPAEARPQALEKLNQQLLTAIEESRDKTTRAADPKANQDVAALAADISKQLRHAEFVDW